MSSATYYVASMASFAVITACYNNIAIQTTFQRDAGVLKRTNGTPLPSGSFLGARVVHALFIAVILVVITNLAERRTPGKPASLFKLFKATGPRKDQTRPRCHREAPTGRPRKTGGATVN